MAGHRSRSVSPPSRFGSERKRRSKDDDSPRPYKTSVRNDDDRDDDKRRRRRSRSRDNDNDNDREHSARKRDDKGEDRKEKRLVFICRRSKLNANCNTDARETNRRSGERERLKKRK